MDQTVVENKNTQVGRTYTRLTDELIQQVPPAIVATYRLIKVNEFRSALEMTKSVKAHGLFAILVGIVNFFSGWPYLLGLFDVGRNAANWVESVTSLLAIVATANILLILYRAYRIDQHEWYYSRSTLYARQLDGSIEVHRITGKCPIPGCPGTLHLGKLSENKESVHLVGICNKHRERHTFEFDDETYQGIRIEELTPVEKNK